MGYLIWGNLQRPEDDNEDVRCFTLSIGKENGDLRYRHASEAESQLDRYWRLRDRRTETAPALRKALELAGSAYPVGKSAPKDVLLEVWRRIDRGDLCYYSLPTEELKRFTKDRNLTPIKDTRKEFITALESADEEQSFPRFLDLPAELRTSIYEYYIANLPGVLGPCSQPPLTKTCRLIRKESAPIFYNRTTFVLDLHSNRSKSQLTMTRDTDHFLARLSPRSMSAMRSLELSFDYELGLHSVLLENNLAGYTVKLAGCFLHGYQYADRSDRGGERRPGEGD
ncbi:hypothetical protein LTR37_002296 [Vermiconidia calcicola]|uniref:Uncharacterized protein n=1 Tax=Vermiconidia calcicola TaxID=1690605 RepID=A0ACC3NUL8_9PEZI|nr:hypothetical protein LTR37_002296 [Vermiconidia calcicola]